MCEARGPGRSAVGRPPESKNGPGTTPHAVRQLTIQTGQAVGARLRSIAATAFLLWQEYAPGPQNFPAPQKSIAAA